MTTASENIQFPQSRFVDDEGYISLEWQQWLLNPQVLTINFSTAVDVASGGTGLTSGTPGGVLAFITPTTIASSALLAQHGLVLGGGALATPATPVGLGTTTTVLHGNAAGDPSYGAVTAADAPTLAPLASPAFTGTPSISLTDGQIAFPATQNPSANANTLDDYEEGTWTPAINFGGAAVGVTYSSRTGTYTKIGRLVIADCFFFLSSKGSSVGGVTIEGLPFTVSAGGSGYTGAVVWGGLSAQVAVTALMNGGGTNVKIFGASVANTDLSQLQNTDFTNVSYLRFAATFIV